MSSSDLTHRYQINSNVAEMSEDSSSGYSQITPTLSSSNARLSYPSYLTGIDEDTKGELVHSVFDLQHEQKQYNQSGSICAVPLNVCCVCSSEDGLQSLHSDIHVLCASPGCKYSGPIHRKCLEHWDSCCDFYCQLLNNATSSIQSSQSGSLSSPTGTTLSSSSVASNFNIGCYDSAVGKSFMEGLFRLYECPLCGQYTLYRSSIDSTTAQAESSLSDHFTSVLCAIQYATEKLNQHESLIHPALHSDVLQFNSQFSLNSPVDYNSGSVEVSPNFTTGDLKFQQMSTIGQHATGRSHSYVQSPPITNQFVNILRRFSLNREKNETNCLSTGSNTSSGMSSGYYSGLSTSDNSVDPSRRNSNTSYQSLMLGRTATGQPTTFIAGTTTKEEEEEEEVVMKLHEDNSIPWMMPTSQSLPRALTKGSGTSSSTKSSVETSGMNDILQHPTDVTACMPAAPIGVSSTRRTYSTIDFEEIFDTSLDVTVNNTTSSHNNSIGSSNNISTHTNSNNMNRSISAIGSRRHHSTSSALGNTNANNTITLINNNTNNNSTSSGGINNNNFKSNSAWSTESVNRPRITHWHNNNNNNETKSRKAVNTKGNIFLQRSDFSVFTKLPNYKQNAYFIQMDDDSCTGNEDTRAFLLAQLTNHRVSEVYCLACQQILPIYDHFPVIDGIFFISPLCHRSTEGYRKGGGLRVTWHTNGIQNQSVQQQQQQQQHQPQQQQQTNRTCTTNNNSNSSSSSNIGNNGSTNLVSSTNDYQCINKIALKLLAPLKIMSPPPGCLGPRQQLNSAQHNNMMSTLTSDQNSLFSASTSSSRYSVVGTSTRQGRYLHALCMNCMHTEHLVVNTHDSKRNGSDNNSNNNDNNNNNNNNNNNKSSEFKCIRCKVCSKLWSGASLLVGGLYTYDIFAAVPCCPAHLTCGSCQSRLDDFSNQSSSSIPPSSTSTTSGQIVSTSQAAIQQLSSNDLPHQYYHDQKNHTLHSMTNRIDEIHDKSSSDLTIKSYPLSYFSQYSNMIICPYCSKVDYHFVKLFEDTYEVVSCC